MFHRDNHSLADCIAQAHFGADTGDEAYIVSFPDPDTGAELTFSGTAYDIAEEVSDVSERATDYTRPVPESNPRKVISYIAKAVGVKRSQVACRPATSSDAGLVTMLDAATGLRLYSHGAILTPEALRFLPQSIMPGEKLGLDRAVRYCREAYRDIKRFGSGRDLVDEIETLSWVLEQPRAGEEVRKSLIEGIRAAVVGYRFRESDVPASRTKVSSALRFFRLDEGISLQRPGALRYEPVRRFVADSEEPVVLAKVVPGGVIEGEYFLPDFEDDLLAVLGKVGANTLDKKTPQIHFSGCHFVESRREIFAIDPRGAAFYAARLGAGTDAEPADDTAVDRAFEVISLAQQALAERVGTTYYTRSVQVLDAEGKTFDRRGHRAVVDANEDRTVLRQWLVSGGSANVEADVERFSRFRDEKFAA